LRDIRQVAAAAGVTARGERLVAELQGRWHALAAPPAPADRPRVLVLEWSDPPFYAGHWVPEMVAVAGGRDVLGEAGAPSRRAPWSRLLETDPDLVVMAACGYDLAANVAFAEALYRHPEARELRAVRSGHVYAADANAYFSRPGPRVVEGAELLRGLFRGEVSAGKTARVFPTSV
jgi:iron complex transport system substrate-binding protein